MPKDAMVSARRVVGIGASAGGLEALERLFDALPGDTKMAFVVIQHLSPDFKSLMDVLLARHTQMRIVQVEHDMLLQPDTVYLLPARKELTLNGRRLQVAEQNPAAGVAAPVDTFFESLADECGEDSVAVVLSGSGSDGSRGVRKVRKAGGVILVQSPESAQFDGMPQSAIDSESAHVIGSPRQIGEALVRVAKKVEAPVPLSVEDDGVMNRLMTLLQRESGIDFAGYKASTVFRRIDRRISLTASADLENYLERVEEDPAELRRLYKDLLIGVTRFFRDPEAWSHLRREVIPGLIGELAPEEELRIWVAGCATGEEAYTVAMAVCEVFRELGQPPRAKLFATDVHRASLDLAGAGVYSADAVQAVPEPLRARYFMPHADGVQVASDLRSLVVFAEHNVLRDAPFTRLDLLTCRNLLIYLTADVQRRVTAMFHFALRVGGVLVLGPSEGAGELADEMEVISNRWKMYRKQHDVSLRRDLAFLEVAGTVRRGLPRREPLSVRERRVQQAQSSLLEHYAPPSLLLDGNGTMLHSFGGGGRFLHHHDGQTSLEVTDMLEGELRFVVSTAIRRAFKEDEVVRYQGVRTVVDGRDSVVDLAVLRLPDLAGQRDCVLVSFEPHHQPIESVAEAGETVPAERVAEERIAALEGELRQSKENLQATMEEMEASNEELQATNEELIASNEELQSTNEELHSVNEELYTVNAEHQAKIAELTELNQDIQHLLEATQVHTLFLDRDLRLRKFTPKMSEVLDLLPHDVGRRFQGVAHGLEDDELLQDMARVLEKGKLVERETRASNGRAYLLRILPYRSNDEIQGVVMTLVDITALKSATAEVQSSELRYRTLVRAVPSLLWTAAPDGTFHEPQREWEAYTGQPWSEHQSMGWAAMIHPDDREQVEQVWIEAVQSEELYESEGRIWSRRHEGWRHFVSRAAPVLDDRGRVEEWVGVIVDVHEAQTAEARSRMLHRQLEAILQHSPAAIFVKDLSGRYILASSRFETLAGVPSSSIVSRTDYDLFARELAERLRAMDQEVLAKNTTVERELVFELEGESRVYLLTLFPLVDDSGTSEAVAGIAADITDRKEVERTVEESVRRRDQFLAMLSHELRNPLHAAAMAVDLLDDENEQSRAQPILRRQVRHLSRLLDDLLDVARVTRDGISLEMARTDLATVIRRATELMIPGRDAIHLTVRIEDEPLVIEGDQERLVQLVGNLLSNAIRFSGPQANVVVTARKDGDEVVLQVQDDGVGLSEEARRHMFELFYQDPQSGSRDHGGLGIGLALVSEITAAHDGTIRPHSAGPGTGTTIEVRLPAPTATGKLEDGDDDELRVIVSGKADVIVVEDNADTRELLGTLLEMQGHRVRTAESAAHALDELRAGTPDVMILDIGLPDMDGFELCRRIREERSEPPYLVALTGYGQASDREEAKIAGFDEHLVKPLGPGALDEMLARAKSQAD